MVTRFWKDANGNVLMLTGLLFFILLGTGGMAIDLGRQQLVRIKLQQASDAAALAGALAPEGADRASVAMRYFTINFPSEYMGVRRPTPRVTVGSQVQVTAEATMNTIFVRHIGTSSMSSSGNSVVGIDQSSTPQSYDMILALDNSGSMAGNDVGTQYIREPDAAHKARARQSGMTKCRNSPPPWGYTGSYCASNQDYGYTGATRLNAMRYSAAILIDQLLGNPQAQSQIGLVGWAHEVYGRVQLTTDRTLAMDAIDVMFSFGATNSTLGLDDAQRMLTLHGNKDHVQVVVLLTDGQNTFAGIPLASGRDQYNCTGLAGSICVEANRQSLAKCTDLKNKNILVYTIAFGTDATSGQFAGTIRNFLSSCASGTAGSNENEYFFIAPDGASLQAAFSAILESVKKVKIVE